MNNRLAELFCLRREAWRLTTHFRPAGSPIVRCWQAPGFIPVETVIRNSLLGSMASGSQARVSDGGWEGGGGGGGGGRGGL